MDKKSELDLISALVDYHNSWNGAIWKDDLQNQFDEAMGENKIILSTVKLNDKAKNVLHNNPQLNRVVSSLIDAYDDLPYRPDTAFDFCWRAFEILMGIVVKGKNLNQKISDTCEKISKLISANSNVGNTIKSLNEHCSYAGIKFFIQRLVDTEKSIHANNIFIIGDTYDKVIDRVKSVLGKTFYNDFCNTYFVHNAAHENTDITTDNKRKAVMLIKKYLLTDAIPKSSKTTTNPIDFSKYQTLFVNAKKTNIKKINVKRMEVIINCILYTSRCFRFHGNYFSPFKSNLSNLTHYYEYYYFLIYTYAMFWYLLYCYLDTEKIEKIFTLDAVNKSVERSLRNLEKLPNEY